MGRAKRKRRKRIAVLVLVLLLLAGAGGFFLLQEMPEFFRLEEIVVAGNDTIPESELLALTGVAKGDTLWSFSGSQIERRLERHVMISEALVIRDLPRGIQIHVTERRPFLLLVAGERFAVLDGNGIVIDIIRRVADTGLPFYLGAHLQETLNLGQRIVDREVLRVLSFLQGVPPDLLYLVREVEPGPLVWSVYTGEGIQVVLGTPEDLREKLLLVEGLLEEPDLPLPLSRIAVLDVSDPSNPVLREKGDQI